MKILIVDDSEHFRTLQENILEAAGYSVDSASHGSEAIEKANLSKPDMIISDILMPVMDGFELCRTIKTDECLRDIPFIFYSATFTDREDEKLALALGASAFIVKSAESHEFLDSINRLIEECKSENLNIPDHPTSEGIKLGHMHNVSLTKKLIKKVNKLEEERILLEGNEEKHARIIEGLSREYIFYSYNTDKVFTYVSPSVKKILGYSQTEFIASIREFLTENPINKEISTHIDLSFKGEKQPPFEVELFRKDGTNCILEITDLPVLNKQGRVRAVEGIARDVTKRKKAEEALREREEQFRRAFTYSAMGMSIVSTVGQFLEVNNSLCKMLGYSEKDLLRKSFHDITHPEDLIIGARYLERLLSGKIDTANFEKRYLHKDGHTIWVSITTSLLRNETGEPQHFVAQTEDITDNKRIEGELQQSRYYFQSLDRVNKALSSSIDIKGTLQKTVEEMLDIFQSDRAFLMYPCDPDASTFKVPVEATRSEYPGALAAGVESPMNKTTASLIRKLLKEKGPLLHHFTEKTSAKYQVRSHLAMILKPARDKAWILGMHQCSHERAWSEDEIKLFADIGARISSTLGSLVLLNQLEKDISNREKAEEALKDSERNLKKSQQIAHLGSWEWNINDDREVWSDEQFSIFGYEPGEIAPTYEHFIGLLHEEDKMRVLKDIDDALSGKSEYKTEFRILGKGNLERNVLAQGEVFRDKKGKPEKMVGTVLDITDIKKAEALILAQRKLAFYLSATGELDEGLRLCLRGAMEISGMECGGVYLVDPLTGALDLKVEKGFSDEFTKSISHYDAGSKNASIVMEGKSIYTTYESLGLPLDDVRAKEGLRAIAILPVVHKKRVVACLNLSSRKMEVVPEHSRIALETIASQIGSAIARLRIEEALKASEERYALAIEGSNDGLWDRNMETGEVYYSPRWKEIIGYKDEEIPNRMEEWASRVHPEDYDRIMEEIRKHFEGETPFYEAEYRIQHKDGTYRWVLARGASVRDDNGKPTRFAGSHTDITEKKQMEEEFLKAGRLDSLGLLAGGIAHDFNNILTGVLTNIEVLKECLHEDVLGDEDISQSLVYAESSAMRAIDLAKQLLTFSKGGAPVIKPTSVSDLLRETVAFTLRGSNVKKRTYIARSLWNAEIDAGQISQVLNNLLINAKQAMPLGGEIYISAKNERVSSPSSLPLPKGRHIVIAIRDRGEGIAEENLSRIFDPYFTTKGMGSGLGLATSYTIIKRHKGYIKVESSKGEGTTFYVYLPASDGRVKAVNKVRSQKSLSGSGNILLLEDEEIVASSFKMSLLKTDFRMTHVDDGVKALKIYKNAIKKGTPFDLVVADLTIPGGMGGVETLEKLKAVDPYVKAIVCSGYSDDAVMSDYKRYGFCDSLQKPFTKSQLLEKLEINMKNRKN